MMEQKAKHQTQHQIENFQSIEIKLKSYPVALLLIVAWESLMVLILMLNLSPSIAFYCYYYTKEKLLLKTTRLIAKKRKYEFQKITISTRLPEPTMPIESDADTEATIRKTLASLDVQKKSMEHEADAILSELKTPPSEGIEPMGLETPLVDSKGYPRADIDVYRARTLRNRFQVLKTDHKEIEKNINGLLLQLASLKVSWTQFGSDRFSGKPIDTVMKL